MMNARLRYIWISPNLLSFDFLRGSLPAQDELNIAMSLNLILQPLLFLLPLLPTVGIILGTTIASFYCDSPQPVCIPSPHSCATRTQWNRFMVICFSMAQKITLVPKHGLQTTGVILQTLFDTGSCRW